MDISVVIPVYNEQGVIQSTIKDIESFLNKNNLSYEIIVVDDGSSDQTISLVKDLVSQNIVLLEHQKNLGKGQAVKNGVLASQGEIILFTDADNSTSVEHLNDFRVKMNQENADIVIASRALADSVIKIHQKKSKENSGKLGNWLIRHFLVIDFMDTQCGFKLFNRNCLKLFKKQKVTRWGFDFEILFLAKKFGFKTLELPVIWIDNPNSRVKTLDYLNTLKELFMVRFNNLIKKYED